jgi:hypothetical protein
MDSHRDSSNYRTPYSPTGGFTNGYEGDLRAHLMANQMDLLRHSSSSGSSGKRATYSPATHHTGYNHSPAPTPQATFPPPSTSAQVFHHYNGAQASQSKPTPAPKAYKVGLPAALSLSLKSTKAAMQVPPKQSPVPLPANFLAAMTSSPGGSAGQASAGSPQSASRGLEASSTPLVMQPPVQSSPKPVQTSRRTLATPVPIPKFPAMMPQESGTRSARTYTLEPKPSQTSSGVPFQPTSVGTTIASGLSRQPANVELDVRAEPQGFPDVPGSGSMEFVERLMGNLRRVSQQGERP